MHLLVTTIFKSRPQAEEAIRQLEIIGVTDKQISLVMSDETRARDWEATFIDDGDNSDEGSAAGMVAGGLFGALFGAVTTAGAVLIPGLNIIVAGPVLGALAGAAIGAGGGGLIGALIGAGLTESEAEAYQQEIRNGAALLAIKAKDEPQKVQIESILDKLDATGFDAFGSKNPSATRPIA